MKEPLRVLHKYARGIFCEKAPLIFPEKCGIIIYTEKEGEIT